jgi:hypothetical protein
LLKQRFAIEHTTLQIDHAPQHLLSIARPRDTASSSTTS